LKNKIVEINTASEFDCLTGHEKMIVYITSFRLDLYNSGAHCGPRSIQDKWQDENLTPVPSISTIARVLKNQCLTNGRTGYYQEDYPM
jgi:hypothetical protein